jgi:glutamate synthase (NADPH/NADH)
VQVLQVLKAYLTLHFLPLALPQFCTLLGYGADGVCPYLAFEALFSMQRNNGLLAGVARDDIVSAYMKSINVGILKVQN